MRESLDVKVPLMTLCLEGVQKDVIPSPKEASKHILKYLKNTLNFLIEKFVGSRLCFSSSLVKGMSVSCWLLQWVDRWILVLSRTLRSAYVKQSYWTGLVLFGFSYEIWWLWKQILEIIFKISAYYVPATNFSSNILCQYQLGVKVIMYFSWTRWIWCNQQIYGGYLYATAGIYKKAWRLLWALVSLHLFLFPLFSLCGKMVPIH